MPLETFRFFLEQDNFYLEEYARCLAMGAAKSRTEAELRYFTTDLNQVLDAELPSNRALLERVIEMGAADRGGSLEMAPANVAYTSYMHRSPHEAGHWRSWRRCSRALGATWRSRRTSAPAPTSTTRSTADGSAYFSLPSNVEMVSAMRRDFDALVRDEAGSRDLGATTSNGSSPRARVWNGRSGTWPTPWSGGPTSPDRAVRTAGLTAVRLADIQSRLAM